MQLQNDKVPLTTSKKVQKGMHEPIPSSRMIYDTCQRSLLAIIKAQGLYDVANNDYDPGDGDYYEQNLFQEKQSSVYSEMHNPSFQNSIIIILSQMLHNMRSL